MSEWSDWPWVVASYLVAWVALAAYALHVLRRLARARERATGTGAFDQEPASPFPGSRHAEPIERSPASALAGDADQEVGA